MQSIQNWADRTVDFLHYGHAPYTLGYHVLDPKNHYYHIWRKDWDTIKVLKYNFFEIANEPEISRSVITDFTLANDGKNIGILFQKILVLNLCCHHKYLDLRASFSRRILSGPGMAKLREPDRIYLSCFVQLISKSNISDAELDKKLSNLYKSIDFENVHPEVKATFPI